MKKKEEEFTNNQQISLRTMIIIEYRVQQGNCQQHTFSGKNKKLISDIPRNRGW